jgi:hypothetical protein
METCENDHVQFRDDEVDAVWKLRQESAANRLAHDWEYGWILNDPAEALVQIIQELVPQTGSLPFKPPMCLHEIVFRERIDAEAIRTHLSAILLCTTSQLAPRPGSSCNASNRASIICS